MIIKILKKVIFIFSVRWPLLKNGHVPQNFFHHFLQKRCFFRKNIQSLIPIKKVIFIFVAGCLLPFKKDSCPRNCGFAVFSENTAFLKKLLNNEVFSTSFMIKKSYVNFWRKTPPFPKKLSKVPINSFSLFSQKMVNFQKIDKKR